MKINNFGRDVFAVLTSTAMAQIIIILILPVLARTVDQTELGVYFYWLSAASVFIVLATFRLDMAVFIENNGQDIMDLLQLIILIASCVSLSCSLVFFLIIPFVNIGVGTQTLSRYALQSASLIFALALIQSFQAYLVYDREYYKLGFSRIIQSIIISGSLLLAAVIGLGANGLVLFHCIGAVICLFVVIRLCKLPLSRLLRGFHRSRLKEILIKHYRFPLYSMPGDFINTFSNQLPVFFIGAKFGAASVALYALTARVMAAPISLLAGSILTVFKERSAAEYRHKGECTEAYMYTLRSLLLIAVVPFGIAWFLIEDIFAWVFGESWRPAGLIAQILIPMYFLRFLANPLAYTLYIGSWQKYDLLWQISLFTITWTVFSFTNDLMRAVQAYAIGYGGLYIVYMAMSYRCAKGNRP